MQIDFLFKIFEKKLTLNLKRVLFVPPFGILNVY